MNDAHYPARNAARQFTAAQRAEFQLERLNQLLSDILPTNRFYAEKFSGLGSHWLPWTSCRIYRPRPRRNSSEQWMSIRALI